MRCAFFLKQLITDADSILIQLLFICVRKDKKEREDTIIGDAFILFDVDRKVI